MDGVSGQPWTSISVTVQNVSVCHRRKLTDVYTPFITAAVLLFTGDMLVCCFVLQCNVFQTLQSAAASDLGCYEATRWILWARVQEVELFQERKSPDTSRMTGCNLWDKSASQQYSQLTFVPWDQSSPVFSGPYLVLRLSSVVVCLWRYVLWLNGAS